jgi:hypothetical protein
MLCNFEWVRDKNIYVVYRHTSKPAAFVYRKKLFRHLPDKADNNLNSARLDVSQNGYFLNAV